VSPTISMESALPILAIGAIAIVLITSGPAPRRRR
jgi:hypothetical protein